MSPEQILGDKLDFRSDIFSVGIVLYQMVTGQKPFVEDESRTVMQKIRLDRFTPPRKLNPKVPRQLERIMARCMEKMPASRYPTTQALIDDLRTPPTGCRFLARCPVAFERCAEPPPLVEVSPGHVARCWRSPAAARESFGSRAFFGRPRCEASTSST